MYQGLSPSFHLPSYDQRSYAGRIENKSTPYAFIFNPRGVPQSLSVLKCMPIPAST